MAELSHEKRFGRFTSSQVGRLCSMGKIPMTDEEKAEDKRLNPKSKKTTIEGGFAATGLSYIEEKVYEERTGRRIQNESTSRSTSWGKCAEGMAFSKLGIEYTITSELTIESKDIDNYSGSPDGYKTVNGETVVFDIKCPYTLLSYCRLANYCISGDVQKFKDEEPIYYFQLVSNSILLGCKSAELIIFMPYKSELPQLKDIIDKMDSSSPYEYYWIEAALNSGRYEQLPYLIENMYYKNLYTLNFQIPDEDVSFLKERIKLANLERLKF